jgi:hypothetical protein
VARRRAQGRLGVTTRRGSRRANGDSPSRCCWNRLGAGSPSWCTRLYKQLADQPPEIQDEMIRINTDARPLALQVALLVPILTGLLNALRMMRRPDPAPSGAAEIALA